MGERKAVTRAKALAYVRADRAGKSTILDELVELTGWRRDYARAALREAGRLKLATRGKRPPRPAKYGPRVVAALAVCWAVLRAPAGKRLAPMLPVLVPMLRAEGVAGVASLTEDEAELLMGMSAATIDRRLAAERAKMAPRGRSHTKPGSLLKSQIPIRTWADWDDAAPGFLEIDLVGHEGGNSSGEFCFTLTATDIATGWTVNRSVRNKAQKWVFEAIDYVCKNFPFPIKGIDSDNGTEFINAHLLAWCLKNQITFTRSRPGHKNDGAHVEQKNWTRVRELVGYYRYDTLAELAVLNDIWELDAVFANYLLPQQKLVFKQRDGAKVTKRYDKATTPHRRAVAHTKVTKHAVKAMDRTFGGIKPAALSRQIMALTGQLEALALAKKAPAAKPEVSDAPDDLAKRRSSREATK